MIKLGSGDHTRIFRIIFSKTQISGHFIMIINPVSQVCKTIRDIKVRIRPMPIRTIMIDRNETTEVPDIIPIVNHIFLRIIRTEHDTCLCTTSLLLMLASNYIDNPSHCIRAIQQRTGSADHFHTLDIRSDISIRQRMSEHPCPLRLPIEQHQHLVALPDTTDIHRTGRSGRNTKTGNPFFCHKQPGYTF